MAANLWSWRCYAGNPVSQVEGQNFPDIFVIHGAVYGAGVSGWLVSGIDLGSQVVGLQSDELESAWQDLFGQQYFVWAWRGSSCMCAGASAPLALSQGSHENQGVADIDYISHIYCGCGLQCYYAAYGAGNHLSLSCIRYAGSRYGQK